MAQETRIAPIEFSNTPTQVLLNIAENKQQDAARKQQAAFEQQKYLRGLQDEEMKRRYENMKNFNTVIQNKDWSKETRDMYLDQLVKKYSDPNINSLQYTSEIGKDLSKISTYQKYRDQAYQQADDFLKNLPETAKSGFDGNTFKNDFIKNALFNKDGSQKTLEQLQASSDVDLLGETYKSNKHKYYDVASAFEKLPSIIKEAEPSVVSIGNRQIRFKPRFERVNEKTGRVELRTDESGYVEDDVYNDLTSFPNIDALVESSALKFIKDYNSSSKDAKKALLGPRAMKPGTFVDKDNDGLPDLLGEEDLKLIKKGFLTDYIKNRIPDYNLPIDKNVVNVNVGGQSFRKAYDELATSVGAGNISDVSPSIMEYLTSIANQQGKRAKVGLKYVSSDINVKMDGRGKLKLYDKSTNEEIATLNERDFDQEYNKGAFGAQAAGNASGVNWK